MDLDQANRLFDTAERLAADVATLHEALRVEFLSAQLAEVVRATTTSARSTVSSRSSAASRTSASPSARAATAASGATSCASTSTGRSSARSATSTRSCATSGATASISRRRCSTPGTATRVVTREELRDGERVTRYFAVYEMLGGEDKYSWVKNRCTDAEFEDARPRPRPVPPGGARLRPRRPRYASSRPSWTSSRRCPTRSAGWRRRRPARGTTPSSSPGCPASSRRSIAAWLSPPQLEGLPRCPVFCDYHPGNLKWRRREGRGPLRLRLGQARLPPLRRRHRPRLLLQLLGGPRTTARSGSTRSSSSSAPTRTRRRASPTPGR